MKYIVNANTSKESMDNYMSFYKEDNKIWISIGQMEERGFTVKETREIIYKLSECIKNEFKIKLDSSDVDNF